MSDLNDNPAPPRPRKKRRNYALLILAAGMLAFGVAAGTLYYVLRPVTLRIAVGPPGSEDQKLIQLMAQTFARDNSAIRLTPVTTDGAAESIALFAAGKTELAVARGDLNLPANAESVAILRKNVVVLWSAPGLPGKNGKKQTAVKVKSLDELAGHKVGVIGRTQANVTLLRVILTESGINPDKVTVSPVRHQPDRRDGEGSDDRRLHGGRPAQQQDHRGRDHGNGCGARRTEIPADRRFRSDRAKTSAL